MTRFNRSSRRTTQDGPSPVVHQSERPGTAGRRRTFGVATCATAAVLMAGVFSIVAVTTSDVAGAATTPVAATWSGSGPNCSSFVTSTPPAGTVSATLTLNGGGGGGGNTNSGSGGMGGNGAQVTGTFALTHNTGAVSIKLGCGGSGGTTGGGGGSTISGANGGTGFAAGAASGGATDEDVSVDGIAAGGGGGAASGLCLGSSGCTTMVAVAAGGGGGGSRWDCTGSDGPGTGGAGESGGSSTVSAGAAGTAGGDGSSDGGGGGGGATSAGGSGGSGASHNGSTGGNSPSSSAGGAGGGGGAGFPTEAGASGGGGGGGYTGGGGGGGDECTSGDDTGGGGGGGSSAVNSSYGSSVSYNGNGGGGATTGSTGGTGSVSLTWNVDSLSVTNPGTQSNVSGSAISNLTISAPHDTTGGNTVTFGASGLPSGLSINSTSGVISGTPAAACACSVTVTATDSEALSQSTSFTWNVTNTVSVTNPGNQSSLSGTAITPLQINASDTQSGATLTYTATGLPSGLSISSNGRITGTPAAAGSGSVTVTATDGSGYHGSATFTWAVTNTVAVSNPGSQSNLSGTAITALQISATDTQAGATLTYSATGLPAGLTISSSGSITGTPTTACACSVTVKAQDGSGYSGTATFTWTVTNTVSATNPGAQSSVSGSAITPLNISASDTSSTATLAYSDGGTLPPGLSIGGSSGAITGTPTTAGSYTVTITVTDSSGYHAAVTFTWTVSNTLSVTNPGAQSDVSGNNITPLTIAASDSSSTATLSFADNGTLPPGLAINSSTGVVTGSPTIAGTYPVTVTVTDNAGYSANTNFTWTITNTVSVTNPGNQSNLSGTAISGLQIQASDSLPSATLTYADNGTLPPGLAIDPSSGLITGTPTTAGSYGVTITVVDSASFAAQVSFIWTITNTVSVTNPGNQSNPSGTAISALSVGATDSSSTATISYADNGTLPTGLAINSSTGAISGTPTTAGSYGVTITVTDNAGFTGTASFTWAITNTVSVTNPGNQADLSGSAISTLHVAATDTSSTASLSYADNGTLPTGLAINSSTGAISGTPTTAGSYGVTITVTDNAGFTGTASFTWAITNTVSVTNPGDQANTVGTAITTLHIVAHDTSSTATLSYGVTGLPNGLSLDSSTGVISGIPLHSGIYPVVVTATDGAGFSGSTNFTWTIIGPIVRSIKPATGPGAGGTKVKILGSDLSGATSVMFGSVEATSFTVNKPGTKITAVSPSESAGTVDIVVTTPAGPSITSAADRFTFIGPTITSLKPSSGSVAGGTKVVITGRGFQGATAATVKFGPLTAQSVVVNAAGTKITAYTPAEPVSTVNVTVTTPGGVFTLTNGYTFD